MERLGKSDEFGTYYTATQSNYDYEAKNGHKKPESLGQPTLNGNSEKPKSDYTLNQAGWLVLNGKPLRRTRFAKDWK